MGDKIKGGLSDLSGLVQESLVRVSHDLPLTQPSLDVEFQNNGALESMHHDEPEYCETCSDMVDGSKTMSSKPTENYSNRFVNDDQTDSELLNNLNDVQFMRRTYTSFIEKFYNVIDKDLDLEPQCPSSQRLPTHHEHLEEVVVSSSSKCLSKEPAKYPHCQSYPASSRETLSTTTCPGPHVSDCDQDDQERWYIAPSPPDPATPHLDSQDTADLHIASTSSHKASSDGDMSSSNGSSFLPSSGKKTSFCAFLFLLILANVCIICGLLLVIHYDPIVESISESVASSQAMIVSTILEYTFGDMYHFDEDLYYNVNWKQPEPRVKIKPKKEEKTVKIKMCRPSEEPLQCSLPTPMFCQPRNYDSVPVRSPPVVLLNGTPIVHSSVYVDIYGGMILFSVQMEISYLFGKHLLSFVTLLYARTLSTNHNQLPLAKPQLASDNTTHHSAHAKPQQYVLDYPLSVKAQPECMHTCNLSNIMLVDDTYSQEQWYLDRDIREESVELTLLIALSMILIVAAAHHHLVLKTSKTDIQKSSRKTLKIVPHSETSSSCSGPKICFTKANTIFILFLFVACVTCTNHNSVHLISDTTSDLSKLPLGRPTPLVKEAEGALEYTTGNAYQCSIHDDEHLLNTSYLPSPLIETNHKPLQKEKHSIDSSDHKGDVGGLESFVKFLIMVVIFFSLSSILEHLLTNQHTGIQLLRMKYCLMDTYSIARNLFMEHFSRLVCRITKQFTEYLRNKRNVVLSAKNIIGKLLQVPSKLKVKFRSRVTQYLSPIHSPPYPSPHQDIRLNPSLALHHLSPDLRQYFYSVAFQYFMQPTMFAYQMSVCSLVPLQISLPQSMACVSRYISITHLPSAITPLSFTYSQHFLQLSRHQLMSCVVIRLGNNLYKEMTIIMGVDYRTMMRIVNDMMFVLATEAHTPSMANRHVPHEPCNISIRKDKDVVNINLSTSLQIMQNVPERIDSDSGIGSSLSDSRTSLLSIDDAIDDACLEPLNADKSFVHFQFEESVALCLPCEVSQSHVGECVMPFVSLPYHFMANNATSVVMNSLPVSRPQSLKIWVVLLNNLRQHYSHSIAMLSAPVSSSRVSGILPSVPMSSSEVSGILPSVPMSSSGVSEILLSVTMSSGGMISHSNTIIMSSGGASSLAIDHRVAVQLSYNYGFGSPLPVHHSTLSPCENSTTTVPLFLNSGCTFSRPVNDCTTMPSFTDPGGTVSLPVHNTMLSFTDPGSAISLPVHNTMLSFTDPGSAISLPVHNTTLSFADPGSTISLPVHNIMPSFADPGGAISSPVHNTMSSFTDPGGTISSPVHNTMSSFTVQGGAIPLPVHNTMSSFTDQGGTISSPVHNTMPSFTDQGGTIVHSTISSFALNTMLSYPNLGSTIPLPVFTNSVGMITSHTHNSMPSFTNPGGTSPPQPVNNGNTVPMCKNKCRQVDIFDLMRGTPIVQERNQPNNQNSVLCVGSFHRQQHIVHQNNTEAVTPPHNQLSGTVYEQPLITEIVHQNEAHGNYPSVGTLAETNVLDVSADVHIDPGGGSCCVEPLSSLTITSRVPTLSTCLNTIGLVEMDVHMSETEVIHVSRSTRECCHSVPEQCLDHGNSQLVVGRASTPLSSVPVYTRPCVTAEAQLEAVYFTPKQPDLPASSRYVRCTPNRAQIVFSMQDATVFAIL